MTDQKEDPYFPFKKHLDFSGLIRYWKENLTTPAFSHLPAGDLLDRIESATELHEPISDLNILDKHRELLGLLMSVIFPPALTDSIMMGAHIPFDFNGFYATPGYAEVLPFDNPRDDINLYTDIGDAKTGTIIMANLFILKNYYGADVEYQLPILLGVPDKKNGLERIYKLEVDTRFIEVKAVRETKKPDQETISMLLENLYDLELWSEHIDPEDFILSGFALHKLIDVTDQETLSSIKFYLLNRDAVTCGTNFSTIQDKVRSLFRLPELRVGLVFFDTRSNIITSAGISDWNSFMTKNKLEEGLSCSYFKGSIYDVAYTDQKPVIIEDLNKYRSKTIIEKELLDQDIRNIIIAPLISENNVIGILELVSPTPGALNTFNAGNLTNILPMFTAAVNRVLGDLHNEVRAAIQKECTAIHPAVEWKFLNAGYEMIRKKGKKGKSSFPEIVFENVYPLFGMSDIRDSSVRRNQAIRSDLIANLDKAHEVINQIIAFKNMPILNELAYKVELHRRHIEPGLASGAETGIINFLKEEVNPAISLFKDHQELKHVLNDYFNLLSPEYGVIHQKRKEYEDSLARVNDTISRYIDQAEVQAQQIIPHYFEKYKTDGVEYNIYLGQSLLENGEFNELYLRNFRLWQLLTMCDIAKAVDDLKPELAHPVDITQLILVHSEPLAIRFRQDEKRFDVDGAYNIRYEIIKKRIDKAHIKDTGERLTQPGKISIVYSRESDIAEYHRYIEYLRSQNFITGETEHFELEELQGAKGLQALRISINLERDVDTGANSPLIDELVRQLEEV